jgi:threonine/homoserine/homoserine lactone efflux protein
VLDPLLFTIAVLTILGTPGPTNTLLATSGAMAGFRRSLPLLIGELAGYLLAIATIRIVLGPFFEAYPLFAIVLKVVVAGYLAWIAIKLWIKGARLTGEAGTAVTIRSVFVTTLLNPKALIFSLSIVPHETPNLAYYVAALASMIVVVGGTWIMIGHIIGTTAGERHAGLVPRIASVALVAFAGLILATAFR